ncbi:hypothetical protein Tco_1279816 [Tanacetum coccineum]
MCVTEPPFIVEERRIQKQKERLQALIQALDSKSPHLNPWITSTHQQPMRFLGIASVSRVCQTCQASLLEGMECVCDWWIGIYPGYLRCRVKGGKEIHVQ